MEGIMITKSKSLKTACLVVFVAVAAIVVAPGAAFAAGYLDPGSGSTIVQGIIAGIAVICRYARRVKSFFVRSGGQ